MGCLHIHFGIHAFNDLWCVLRQIGATADAAFHQTRFLQDEQRIAHALARRAVTFSHLAFVGQLHAGFEMPFAQFLHDCAVDVVGGLDRDLFAGAGQCDGHCGLLWA